MEGNFKFTIAVRMLAEIKPFGETAVFILKREDIVETWSM